jgi:hypothetical protein
MESLIGKGDLGPAEKYDEISKLVRKRSKELHSIFDTFNFSRSNALIILHMLYNWELLTKKTLRLSRRKRAPGFSALTNNAPATPPHPPAFTPKVPAGSWHNGGCSIEQAHRGRTGCGWS